MLNWAEIASAPNDSGIYAWYFRPELTNFDIDRLVEELQALSLSGNEAKRRGVVKDFLMKRLFRFFEQKPYLVELSGQLKPRYKGEIEHQIDLDLSDGLIDRILETPSRLYHLQKPLFDTTPLFASPLYIGMAENLNSRLSAHKRLILALETTDAFNSATFAGFELSTSERNFAERVKQRGLSPSRLFVVTQALTFPGNPNDVENILNRIYFPVLGRN